MPEKAFDWLARIDYVILSLHQKGLQTRWLETHQTPTQIPTQIRRLIAGRSRKPTVNYETNNELRDLQQATMPTARVTASHETHGELQDPQQTTRSMV